MKTTLTYSMRATVLALSVGLVAGCATTGDVEKAQAATTKAQSTAAEAQSTANRALQAAQDAKTAADAGQACCKENSEKLGHMFHKAMRK